MNIGFYGHSTVSWANDPRSFIEQVKQEFSANIVNVGVPQGSEERILFNLKKTKDPDVAIIFHARPKYLFLPRCRRDISIDSVPTNKAKVFWSENNKETSALEFENEFFSYGKIKEVFENIDTFVQCMTLYKEYLSHPDLQINRYEGALVLIDKFCQSRVKNTIHVVMDNTIPSWFTFSSGIINNELKKIMYEYYKPGNPNNLSEEGNAVMSTEIIKILRRA